MKAYLLVICVLVSSLSIKAANTTEKPKVDLRAINDFYEQKSDELKEYLKKDKFEAGKLTQYQIIFKSFSENENIDKATNIYKEYFVKTAEYLRKIIAMKLEIERAEEIKDFKDERYLAAKKYYKPVFEEFVKYFENPPKIKRNK